MPIYYEYSFHPHFHPYVGLLIQKLNKGELKDMLDVSTQNKSEDFFEQFYQINPEEDEEIIVKYFDKKIEFEVEGAYSIYNWELFFHIPLAIAVQLTKNQRFMEAQRWFHFIFNPLTDETEDPNFPTHRYWNFLPFRADTSAKSITELLENLSTSSGNDPVQKSLRERLRLNIAAWRNTPFSPHEVAKFRPMSYQFSVVMKYLDMLIAWGDSLFRQFTIEAINEATQLYVLANNILGPRPQKVPQLSKRPIRNYKQLKSKLDEFGNAMIEMENEFPLNTNTPGPGAGNQDVSLTSLLGIGRQLYFCVPENTELLTYWDTVADRLFKIRNCMDIEGNIRKLSLFEPPISPGMLVKAAAGGIDIGSIVAGLGQPVSNVRFQVILQKALELASELKSMGGALLSALEKADNEKLSLIRQEHEIKMLELSQDIKYLQWKEAEASTEALINSREAAYQRYRHYQLLLGKKEEDFSELEGLSLERKELSEANFTEVYANLVEKYGQQIDLEAYREEKLGLTGEVASKITSITGFADSIFGIGGSELLQLNKMEDIDINVLMPLASTNSFYGMSMSAATSLLSLIPQFGVKFEPLGVGGDSGFGGVQLSGAVEKASGLVQKAAGALSFQAERASKLGSYHRRIGEWVFSNNQASKELSQIGKQVITALIREQSLKKDYENHKVQIEQSRKIDEFLRAQKYTNEALYLWMQGEISKVYYDCYKLAFDTAKKAEVTMKYELMQKELDERDFIKFNYWDAGRKGLLSGESLYLDLKRLELAYLESNKREFEITKHISLQQLNPLALLELKSSGTCTIDIPEWLFDLDCPGHYMRRIKSMSLSIPCIVGPYASINCTLALQKSTIRTSSLLLNDAYDRQQDEDSRFRDYFGSIQSIVTSNAQNDSGMFEVNFRDERFLPFEGSGVISTWRLELPEELRQFDYNTISDIILHMRYTARQAGNLKSGAIKVINDKLKEVSETGLVQLFNLKQDFPDAWYRFIQADPAENLKLDIRRNHFPYLVQSKDLKFLQEGQEPILIKIIKFKNDEIESKQYSVVSFDVDALNNAARMGEMVIDKDCFQEPDVEYYLALNYGI